MADSKPWTFFVENTQNYDSVKQKDERPMPILGAIPFGGSLSIKDTHKIINEFVNDMNELHIDGAYLYGNEEICSTEHDSIRNAILRSKISTKVTPMFALNNNDPPFSAEPTNKKYIGLTEDGVKKQFEISLNKLKRDSVDVLYLHWMDITTDINITLKAINDLYTMGKFKRFGLSNFYAWQVSAIYQICKQNNYVLPSLYQGHYNPICRDVETELFPCLRYYNIQFCAFGVLANGLLAGKYVNKYDKDINEIDENARMNIYFSMALYWRQSYFDAFNVIKTACDKIYGSNVNYADIVMRWMVHHSALRKGDGIICGISQYKYFKPTINSIKHGAPLHTEVLKAFDSAWGIAKKESRGYLQWNTKRGIIRTDDPFSQPTVRSFL